MTRTLPALLAAALLLVACGGGDTGNNSSEDAGAAIGMQDENLQDDPNNSVVPLSPPTPAPTAGSGSGPGSGPAALLPGEFHGRWGEGDADCLPGRPDAGGLMIVSADGLRFHQSRARIEKVTAVRPGTLQLDLAFTGTGTGSDGGQEWNRRQTLTLVDGGRTLIRAEQRPAGSFRYVRCPAGRETPVDQRGA